MAHRNWFVLDDNIIRGPFRGSDIQELADRRVLSAETLVSIDEMNWTPARKVKGLKLPSELETENSSELVQIERDIFTADFDLPAESSSDVATIRRTAPPPPTTPRRDNRVLVWGVAGVIFVIASFISGVNSWWKDDATKPPDNAKVVAAKQPTTATSEVNQLKDRIRQLEEAERRRQSTPAPAPQIVVKEVQVEPKIYLPSSPPEMSADIIVRSVQVANTKANGAAWDINGGAPDLKVYIEKKGLFGANHTSTVKFDTYFAIFDEKSIRVKEGDTIRIKVWDQDVAQDDLIGEYTKKITADTIRERIVHWRFDQVIELVLEFQP